MRGYIYILCTDDRPETVKIGKTTRHPDKRCAEHNKEWYLSINTWTVSFWCWVENCDKAEREIHILLEKYNLGAKRHREAFKIDIVTARDIALRVCDRYPAKSNKKTDPILRKKKELDNIAYIHIISKGILSETIIENKKTMKEVDYYKWLSIASEYIVA